MTRPRSTPARASAKKGGPPPGRDVSDLGVARCIELMVSGAWVSGTSHEAVAREFGREPSTVRGWATSANRVIRALHEVDREDIRARYLGQLETVLSRALGKQSATMTGALYDAPDLSSAVRAIETSAKLLGLITQKHEVTAPLSDEQARAKYKELTGLDWPAKGATK